MSQDDEKFDEIYRFIEVLNHIDQTDTKSTNLALWKFNHELCDNSSENRVIYCCDDNAWVVKFAFVNIEPYLVVSKIVKNTNMSTKDADKITTIVRLSDVCKGKDSKGLRGQVNTLMRDGGDYHYNHNGNLDKNGYEKNAVYYIDPFSDMSQADISDMSQGVDHYNQNEKDVYFTTMFPYIAVFDGKTLRCISSNNYPSNEECHFPWWSGVNVTKITGVNFIGPAVQQYINTSFSYLEGAPVKHHDSKYILKKFIGALFDGGIISGKFTAFKIENTAVAKEETLILPFDIYSKIDFGLVEIDEHKFLSYGGIAEVFFNKKNRYSYTETIGKKITVSNDFKKTVQNLLFTSEIAASITYKQFNDLNVEYIDLKVAKKADTSKKGTKKGKGGNKNGEGQDNEDTELSPSVDVELEITNERQMKIQEFDDAINKKASLLKIEIESRKRNGKKRPSLDELRLISEINELYGQRTTFLFGHPPPVTRTKNATIEAPPTDDSMPTLAKIREEEKKGVGAFSTTSYRFRVSIYRKGRIHPAWNIRFRKYYPFGDEKGSMFYLEGSGNLEGITSSSIPVEFSKKTRLPTYGFIKIDVGDNHTLFNYDIRNTTMNDVCLGFIEGSLVTAICLKRFGGLNNGFYVSRVMCILTNGNDILLNQ